MLAFKKMHLAHRRTPPPTAARVEKLTRQLWEFGEQVRIAALDTAGFNEERSA